MQSGRDHKIGTFSNGQVYLMFRFLGEIVLWESKFWKMVGSCVFFGFLAFYTGKLILDHFILSLPDMVMPSNVFSGSSAKIFCHLFTSFLFIFPPCKWFQSLTFKTFVKSVSVSHLFFLNTYPSVPLPFCCVMFSLAIIADSLFGALFASFIPTALKYWLVSSSPCHLNTAEIPCSSWSIASCRSDFQCSSPNTSQIQKEVISLLLWPSQLLCPLSQGS